MEENIEKKGFKKVGEFFKGFKIELKKIIWPTPKLTFKNTGIVLVMILVVGVFVFALDSGLIYLLGKIMKMSK